MSKPSAEAIMRWKTEYGAVHAVRVEDAPFYYRSLSTSEYMAFVDLSKSMGKEDWSAVVVKVALLHGDTKQFTLAGSMTSLAMSITSSNNMDEEGYGEAVVSARTWAKDHAENAVTYALAIKAATVFPGANLFNMLTMPTEQLFRTIALLEISSGASILSDDEALEVKKINMSEEDLSKQGVSLESINAATDALSNQIKKHR